MVSSKGACRREGRASGAGEKRCALANKRAEGMALPAKSVGRDCSSQRRPAFSLSELRFERLCTKSSFCTKSRRSAQKVYADAA